MHVCVNIYIHRLIHIYVYNIEHACMCIYIHRLIRSVTSVRSMHACPHANKHANAQTHGRHVDITHTHTHAHAHRHTHTHTLTIH